MIELTEEMRNAVEAGHGEPVRVVDPATREAFVLLRAVEYERLKAVDYDDSPWTAEERDALALEAGKAAGWEDIRGYDDTA